MTWLSLLLALGLTALPASGPTLAGTAGRTPARAKALSPEATSALLARLTLCAHPAGLAGLHLQGIESWTAAGRNEPGEVETDRVVYYRFVPIEVEQTQNHHPLSAAAAKRERRHLARLERAVDREAGAAPAAAASGRLVNLEGEIWTVDRLAAQFEWSGAAAPDGRIELRFTPAPHRRLATRLERMLSRTAGSLTVDAATGQIEAGGFHSLGPVWFGAGIVAHFASFSGSFSLQPLGDCWVMRRVEAELEGRELFHRIHGTETMLYSEREP